MTLPASGPISFNNINVELGVSGTTQASLGQSSYRTLAGVPSGAISMSNFYGKANAFPFTISTDQTNANLRSLALAAGWNGTSTVIATINSGIYISSNSTSTPALTISGAFPGGVTLNNAGYIVGMGGAGGGTSPGYGPAFPGSPGGLALSVSVATTINNTGTIAGGGGGGGGGPARYDFQYDPTPLALPTGGGGGRSSKAANSAGGYSPYGYSGGPGTVNGAGGGRNYGENPSGAGGNWGSAGGSGYASPPAPWGNSTSGGSGGGSVSGNSNITWTATGTRLGSIT